MKTNINNADRRMEQMDRRSVNVALVVCVVLSTSTRPAHLMISIGRTITNPRSVRCGPLLQLTEMPADVHSEIQYFNFD